MSGRIKSTKFRGTRPRASTLPSFMPASAILESDGSLPRDNYSDSFPLDDPSTISTHEDFDDDFDEDFDDDDDFEVDQEFDNLERFGDVTYDDVSGSDSDDDEQDPNYVSHNPENGAAFFHNHPVDNVLGLMDDLVQTEPQVYANSIPVDSDPHMLSGLSEEDDSDMEEDLEIAALQIKHKSSANGEDSSPVSSSRPPSVNSSPRHYRKHNNSNSSSKKSIRLQPSFDTGSVDGKVPRRMSVPTKPYAQTLNGNLTPPLNPPTSGSRRHTPDLVKQPPRRPTDPGPPTSTSNSLAAPNGKGYSEATLAAQEKFEIGLGLREPQTPIPHSTSSKSLKSLKARSERSLLFGPNMKKPVAPAAARPSLLSSQIKDKQSGFDNPLEEYVSASGKAERNNVRLKMYMPSCDEPRKSWEVIVRTDTNVSNAIGFALYCYMEEKRTPALPEDMCNANKWTLRIVEDDGEPDEDFPALDRTRMLSAYSFDEFALVEATPAQVIEHEKVTPSTRKAKATKPAAAKDETQSKAEITEEPEEDDTPENVMLRVYQYPFDEMVSVLYWSGEVSVQTTVDDIAYQICVDKGLDRTQYVCKIAGHRSVIPTGVKVGALDGQMNLELTPRRVVNKTNGYTEELFKDIQPIKKIQSANAISSSQAPPSSSSRRTSWSAKRPSMAAVFRNAPEEPSAGRNSSSGVRPQHLQVPVVNNHMMLGAAANTSIAVHHRAASNVRASMLAVPPSAPGTANKSNHRSAPSQLLLPENLNGIAGFQKYKIWRRQPMSFISRHERVLALDGEYVHIMPSDDRAWYDYSPKTSSFHISQMTNCKQSRKIPNNFKVVIMKTTGVSKRYDLEAPSAADAQEIVDKLKGLLSGYKMNKDSSQRH